MDDGPELPDLTREMLTFDPERYAALHSVPPPERTPASRHRVRDLVILLIVTAVPAAVFAAVISGSRHTELLSPGMLVVFLGTWALMFLVGAARSIILRDR